MRNGELKVVIYTDVEKKVLKARAGRRLKELFCDAGISFPQPCGGNGRCGKCVVTFTAGAPKAGALDKNFLNEQELEQGKRLLCRCVLESDCEIDLTNSALRGEEQMVAESVEESTGVLAGECDRFGIAVDIGTTTVVAALIGRRQDSCAILDTGAVVNHQRKYGADVISRIDAASDPDVRKQLQTLILEEIDTLISDLLLDNNVKELSDVVITGNTTMIYLLRGYDVSELGVYPYRAGRLNKSVATITYKELMEGKDNECDGACRETVVHILPGISAFVGSDIVAGIYLLELPKKALFIDLGTNGEMAYSDGKELRVTSTAAGPVFEGGGISCGMASVPGAIYHVTIESGAGESVYGEPRVTFETIGGKAPTGLCGTGVIEAVAELRRSDLINSDGLFIDRYFEEGFELARKEDGSPITITQKDIRSVQLAKAAINAGMETLLSGDRPEVIYIAGGFGTGLLEEKIRGIRLFSQNYCDNINVIGNSSLKGGIKYLEKALFGKEDEEKKKLSEITDRAKEIVLAGEDGFDDRYMDALGF